jgi:hypothetical protein
LDPELSTIINEAYFIIAAGIAEVAKSAKSILVNFVEPKVAKPRAKKHYKSPCRETCKL